MSDGPPLVLVADDDPDILRLVSRRMTRCGYAVATAGDGREALRKISDRPPAVAILDWMMPGLSGPEVCSEVKRAPGTSNVRVVLLTARATDSDVAAGEDCDADAYMIKPFDLNELERTVSGLMSRPDGENAA